MNEWLLMVIDGLDCDLIMIIIVFSCYLNGWMERWMDGKI